MSIWPLVSLESVAAPFKGAITDGPFGSNLTSAHYTESGPLVVRLQNIGDGVFRHSPAHIPEDHFASLRKHEVRAGDLLVSSLGETLPRACLAPADLGPAIVKADCIRVRLSEDVDKRWVLYALQRPAARHWARQHLHGVGRPRLGLKLIRDIPVPLPPLAEQRRIVDVLENHLSRLDAADSLLEQSQTRARSLSSAALGRAIDIGQDRRPLGELVSSVEAGRSFGGSAAPAKMDEWGIIKVSAMTWGSFRPEENKAVPEARVDRRFTIRRGDVLVSRANTSAYVGACVLVGDVPDRLLLSDKSLRLVPREGVDPTWLVRALSTPRARQQISDRATGTKDSMRNIAQATLLSVELPARSPAQQLEDVDRAARSLDAVREVKETAQASRKRGRLLRRALLAAAFSGRLTGHRFDVDRAEQLAT